MKRWWFGPKKHIDEEKRDQERRTLADFRELIDNRDLDGYIALIKRLKPEMTGEELEKAIDAFRSQTGFSVHRRSGGADD